MSSIAVGLSAAKTGFDLAKGVVTLLQREKLDVNEIQQRLIELQDLILSAKAALVEAQEENDRLQESVREKDKALRTIDDLQWAEDGSFWTRKSERENGVLIRYCSACWGENTKLVPLAEPNPGAYHCVIHNHTFTSQKYLQWKKEVQNKMNVRRIPRSAGGYSPFS